MDIPHELADPLRLGTKDTYPVDDIGDDGRQELLLLGVQGRAGNEVTEPEHGALAVNADEGADEDGKILVADAVIPLSDSCKATFFELLSHKSIFLKAEPTVLKEK